MNLLVTGFGGQLANEFYRLKSLKKFKFYFASVNELNICSYQNIKSYTEKKNIDCILNCAAYTNVRKAEIDRKQALRVNSHGVKNLIRYCETHKVKMIHFSTDYVYNSPNKKPIKEDEYINPLNFYGFSKREGEKYVEKSLSESIVIRTSWLYSKYGNNFVNSIIEKSKNQEHIYVVNDQFGCPTYAKDLAEDVLKILDKDITLDKQRKIYNYSNDGFTNWFDFAKNILKYYNNSHKLKPVSSDFFNDEIKRPKFAVTSKINISNVFEIEPKDWKNSLSNYLEKDLK